MSRQLLSCCSGGTVPIPVPGLPRGQGRARWPGSWCALQLREWCPSELLLGGNPGKRGSVSSSEWGFDSKWGLKRRQASESVDSEVDSSDGGREEGHEVPLGAVLLAGGVGGGGADPDVCPRAGGDTAM